MTYLQRLEVERRNYALYDAMCHSCQYWMARRTWGSLSLYTACAAMWRTLAVF